MARKTSKTSAPATNPIADALRAGVEKLDGASIVPSPSGNYYTVKVGKTTIGYVNGKTKMRVDYPTRGGKTEKMAVTTPAQVTKALAKMESFRPKPEAKQPAKATPAKAKATSSVKAKSSPAKSTRKRAA